MSLLRIREQGHQPGFESRFSAVLCIRFIHSFASVIAVPKINSLTHERTLRDLGVSILNQLLVFLLTL